MSRLVTSRLIWICTGYKHPICVKFENNVGTVQIAHMNRVSRSQKCFIINSEINLRRWRPFWNTRVFTFGGHLGFSYTWLTGNIHFASETESLTPENLDTKITFQSQSEVRPFLAFWRPSFIYANLTGNLSTPSHFRLGHSVDPGRRLVWGYTGQKGQYIFRTPLLWKLATPLTCMYIALN